MMLARTRLVTRVSLASLPSLRSLHIHQAVAQKRTPLTVRQSADPSLASERETKDTTDFFTNLFDRGPNVGIEYITKQGFILSNNVQVNQPLVLLNGSAFLWNPPLDYAKQQQWNMDLLAMFDLVSPKPELILFGTGTSFAPLPDSVRRHFHQLGIQVDVMNTKHAAATYNVLAEEGRRVAAALLPSGV
ncbi:DUF498-domain-containing protein [Hesseltinella vesiculosa]|uniref:NADH dehydrogenase [ubiquinone] 1 alpha subcomplex assembly factor 3 n=1 Tax=Hesseltinella vesiculosa TaxID=101127 RepID=A0A1X2GXF8_9FUNG|nr:DUF498-domain-containing protein [Hesseltinella vesiculosa]